MSLLTQAAEIKTAVEAACTGLSIVYSSPPSTIEGYSATVSPAPEWGTFDGGTFCDPVVSWEVVLVTPVNDFGAAMDWFYERITELAASADVGVASWQQIERINLGSGDGFAVRVSLDPRPLED
jgi:hypothetical protein